jgi:post-segregation antitoxin (ccd killing protein)
MGPEDDDLRGDLETAFGEDGGTEVPPAPPPVDKPLDTPPAPESVEAVAPKGERDALGRFLKKDAAAAPTPGVASPPAPGGPLVPATPAAAPPAPGLQAPAGWGPAVREHWANLPQPVQEYVHQREQQMQRWANDTAPMRQAGEQFIRAVEPYMMTIRAEGVDPLTAVTNLMQFGTTLRFGTPHEKATVISQCIQLYGVDIPALDALLAGQAPPQGQAPQINVQAEVQRALAPLMQQAQQRQQWEWQQTNEQARSELLAFAEDPKHEFISDVREIMADLIEVAERQRYPLPLQDAYDRACALHPEVSKVIMARQHGVNASKLTQNAQRARAAAVSVKGVAPVGNPTAGEPSSIRESIEAAIDAHSRV